jgi:hypothetical protein
MRWMACDAFIMPQTTLIVRIICAGMIGQKRTGRWNDRAAGVAKVFLQPLLNGWLESQVRGKL